MEFCDIYFTIGSWLFFFGRFFSKVRFKMLCGYIESNPGPMPNSGQIFPICHWNLNSISAHVFS